MKINPFPHLLRVRHAAISCVVTIRARISKRLNRSRILTIALAGITIVAFVSVLLLTPPVPWLPKASDADVLLGTMLTAQAAIAALTLAVTLFVMQGVSNRPDTDHRIYQEYIRQSWIRFFFWGSILAVLATGMTLFAQRFAAPAEGLAHNMPGLRNLLLLSMVAFITNLGLVALLFERAIRIAHPERWRSLRLDANKRDVEDAVQSFIRRCERATSNLQAGEPNLALVFPGPKEGSANEGIQALLDDALRAMADRRLREFRLSIEAIQELVAHAMNEIERRDIGFGPPGSDGQWPPLWELASNLYSFRQEVIRASNRDYLKELLRLDYWLVRNGIRRNCGELFTFGLSGYRSNYRIANRTGIAEYREMLRDQIWHSAPMLIYGEAPEKVQPYIKEMIKHQLRILSDAMVDERKQDVEEIHRRFKQFLQNVLEGWKHSGYPPAKSIEESNDLLQEYRAGLMGLGGRAVILVQSGEIADASPYLDAARREYNHLSQLAKDTAYAMEYERLSGSTQWYEWEMENVRNGESRSFSQNRYPLTFFSIRLLELSEGTMPTLDFEGHAQRILEWFTNNSEGLESYVSMGPDSTMANLRKRVTKALQAAVHDDEVRWTRPFAQD